MPEARYRNGDVVRFRFATRTVQGEVKEDHGPIGVRGQRPYLVEFRADLDNVAQVELPAEETEPAVTTRVGEGRTWAAGM